MTVSLAFVRLAGRDEAPLELIQPYASKIVCVVVGVCSVLCSTVGSLVDDHKTPLSYFCGLLRLGHYGCGGSDARHLEAVGRLIDQLVRPETDERPYTG
jgi:hypothetical protein